MDRPAKDICLAAHSESDGHHRRDRIPDFEIETDQVERRVL